MADSFKIDQASLKRKLKISIEDKGNLKKIKASSLKELSNFLVSEMKRYISQGISPITGKRFQAYKDPKKYPGKQKPQRPVNLKLTGQFLKSLVGKIKAGKSPEISISFNNSLAEKKELGHREGANSQRKRPIIPIGEEGFADAILVKLREVLRKIIDKDLK